MGKKWIILAIVSVTLFIFWQMGVFDDILARTVFAPDSSPSSSEEDTMEEDPGNTLDEEEGKGDPSIPSQTQEKRVVYPGDLVYEIEVLAENLVIPWEILPLPDGRLIVTERPGRVVLLDKGEKYPVHDVAPVGEGGLLGIEKSVSFEENRHLFLYYTYRDGNRLFNRVSRFTLDGNILTDEKYIMNEIPGSRLHNGGRLKMGPDDKLYISIGDVQDPSLSQDIHSLAGKILRVNEDGSIPEDNPFEDSPVYAFGFRNPQGLAWHPISGALFASDHGPNRQDEINLVLPGKNYGWPNATCVEGDALYEKPVACYPDYTLAPSGIGFLPWENLKETPLFAAGLRGNMVMRIDLSEEGKFISQEALFTDLGRIRTVVYHEDALYIATNNRDGRGVPLEGDDKIIRITPLLPPVE